MKEGSLVKLRSSKTEMTIERTEKTGHVNAPVLMCHCVWLDSLKHVQRSKFRSTSLILIEE